MVDRPVRHGSTAVPRKDNAVQTADLVSKMASEVRSSSIRPDMPELGVSCDEFACSRNRKAAHSTAQNSDLRVANRLMFRRFYSLEPKRNLLPTMFDIEYMMSSLSDARTCQSSPWPAHV